MQIKTTLGKQKTDHDRLLFQGGGGERVADFKAAAKSSTLAGGTALTLDVEVVIRVMKRHTTTCKGYHSLPTKKQAPAKPVKPMSGMQINQCIMPKPIS